MCHKDGKNGWVPGSYLMAKSSLRNVTKDGDVLGFPGIIPNSTSLQNGSEYAFGKEMQIYIIWDSLR